jgi:hypothetical protein
MTACSARANDTAEKTQEQLGDIDIDLTLLSDTMVYGEVFNMTNTPDEYLGKTVKASGLFSSTFYDVTNSYYHYVLIEDAAACCQQGLEFIWDGDHIYPDDYPDIDTQIEVTGVFSSYEELGQTYYYLLVDEIITEA